MAKRPITIEDLMYPIGHGSALSMRIIEKDLTDRFYIYANQFIRIKSSYKDGDNYYVHLTIPSENNARSLSEVFYDVVLEFYPRNKAQIALNYFNDYGVKVFSNSPSFLFTFTHVLNEKEALPDFISTKYYAKEALKNPPKVRNPIELLGIDKSIWFAIKYLTHNRLFHKIRFEQMCNRKGSYKNIAKDIKTQEEKLAERKAQKQKPKPKKKKDNKKLENTEPADQKHTPSSLSQTAKNGIMKTNAMVTSMKSSQKHSMSTTSLKNSSLKKKLKK